ncbi:NAD(P)-dependent oxidoreductase [Phototrophicus methaneseepsis]|uniref:NAD(P)-dependent oxidoreductase n=1 Tax=Phototrophicus methaneseepsis TaxID=2710758 RepID=A0A7S8EAW2_9CHLR|nr:NAD(P)-dependent oxidoreductase [Phototrophicus methaneseepsis]QPC83587.1 NAD(P)-dependent oxidoreductase [Phototrophicus methaneseepsis]
MADTPEQNAEETTEQSSEQTLPNVFITNGTNAVGTALVRRLTAAGYAVTAGTDLGSKGAFEIRANGGIPVYPEVTRASNLRSLITMAKATIVINTVIEAVNGLPQYLADWRDYVSLIEDGTKAVAEAASQTGVKRLIHVSAAFAYGDHHGESVDESTHLSTENPLYEAVAHAETAVLKGAVPGYVLRAGYIYGANSEASRHIHDGLTISKSVKTGSGSTAWIQAQSLAEAIMLLVKRDFSDEEQGTIYNIVEDEYSTPDEFITDFGKAMGVDQPALSGWTFSIREPDPVRLALLNASAHPSNAKAKEELGWTPRYNRIAGIDTTLMEWRAAEMLPEPVVEASASADDILALPAS